MKNAKLAMQNEKMGKWESVKVRKCEKVKETKPTTSKRLKFTLALIIWLLLGITFLFIIITGDYILNLPPKVGVVIVLLFILYCAAGRLIWFFLIDKGADYLVDFIWCIKKKRR